MSHALGPLTLFSPLIFFFFFNDTATTEIYTLSLHVALPISCGARGDGGARLWRLADLDLRSEEHTSELQSHVNLVCRLLLEKKKAQKPRLVPGTNLARLTKGRQTRRSITTVSGLQCYAASVPEASLIGFFFFNDTATTEIYTLSLHDALPI